MKILHIITGLNTGGAERMLVKLIEETKNEADHTVISIFGKGKQGEILKSMGIEVYELNVQSYIQFPIRFFKIKRLVASLRPDIIQGWMYHGNVVASLSKYKSTPVLHNIRQSFYSYNEEKALTRLIIKLNGYLTYRTNLVLFNSALSLDQHIKLGFNKRNSYYIANGFDINKYQKNNEYRSEIRKELKLDDDATLLVQVGRNHPMKDHYNFLEAAKLVSKREKKVHFLLVGRGIDEDNHIQSFLDENDLKTLVTLWGERPDIEKIWSAADFGVLSSAWGEGFPNVIGEAMACETPCVVTKVGDSAHVIGDVGFSVTPQNENELADAMVSLCKLSAEEVASLGNKARERIINEFSIQKISDEYMEVYNKILKKRF